MEHHSASRLLSVSELPLRFHEGEQLPIYLPQKKAQGLASKDVLRGGFPIGFPF